MKTTNNESNTQTHNIYEGSKPLKSIHKKIEKLKSKHQNREHKTFNN